MPSVAEHLPLEIWLYIFTFIEGHAVVRAFTQLNVFFDSLLRSPHLQLYLRTKKNESNERLPQLPWSYINLQNIYSISVGQRKANCLIQFLRWHAQYLIYLRSLSVYLRQSTLHNNTQFLTFALYQLPSLNDIRIKYKGLHKHSFNLDPILMHIFRQNSTINRCSFDFEWFDCDLKTSGWFINPNLTHLHIAKISFNKLSTILSFTPGLLYLKASIDSSLVVSHNHFTLSHLRKLDIFIDKSSFAHLRILKQATSCLQCLRFKGDFNVNDDGYINEKLWQELFCNIEYYNVRLIAFGFNGERKQLLINRTRDCQGKKWLERIDNGKLMKVIISFKSSVI
jgi:hypothetical protein